MSNSIIKVSHLTKRYGEFTALDDVSLEVEAGGIYGFLGPNGSGKTTLIKILCGLEKPTSGEAYIAGIDVVANSAGVKSLIGYMSQYFSLYPDLTVWENLNFFAKIYNIPNAESEIATISARLGIDVFYDRLAGSLSGGWKQRLSFACSTLHKPKVLFLDEPTSGIDPVARRALWDIFFEYASGGMTFFVTTHYMDEAERCSNVGYIYLSRLMVTGNIEELKALKSVTPDGFTRYELVARNFTQVLIDLKTKDFVKEATIFGNSIHFLSSKTITHEDLPYDVVSLLPIEPSLEDVFVTLTNSMKEEI